MTEAEAIKILTANNTNRYITENLNPEISDFIIETLLEMKAKDFKELNAKGGFEFGDLPIPYKMLEKFQGEQTHYSNDLRIEFHKLLNLINEKGSNIEYPYVMTGEEVRGYLSLKPFEVGSSQACEYDWNWIEGYIKNAKDGTKISLLHTHPNPLDKKHNTLYNKYPKQLAKLGVQPDGLNISLADIYAGQYLQMLVEKYGKNIETESTILMFDGMLISFSTKNGITLTEESSLKQENIETKEEAPKIERISKDELERIESELHPKKVVAQSDIKQPKINSHQSIEESCL